MCPYRVAKMVGTVNINKATSHKIHTELGISKTKSQAIIEARKKAGGKLAIDDLRKVFKANPDFVEFLLEVGAIEFGSPWVARKSDASSTHLASDANGVSPHTLGVSQQATGVSQPATSVLVIGDATPEADEWKWVNIGDDGIFFWVTEKDKNQAIIQYLSELSPSKSIILLVRDKERVMGVADLLLEAGYPLVYCHEGRTSSQNAEVWDSFSKKRYPILVASLKSDALYSFYDPCLVHPEMLLVDFPNSMQALEDLWEDLCVPTTFISDNDEHVLFDLVDYVSTSVDPCPAWLKQKLAELSSKTSTSVANSKGTVHPDMAVPVSSKVGTCVSPPKECYSSSAEIHSRSPSSPKECYSNVITESKSISSLKECYPDFQDQDNVLPHDPYNTKSPSFSSLECSGISAGDLNSTSVNNSAITSRPFIVPERPQSTSVPSLPSPQQITGELPLTNQWVLQQHQQLAVTLNNYAKGHNKQMEEIQQRKTKLRKDFEDNMRLLQEWEQSITDFDKVVRASFIQEAKRLKEIEQHLRDTATLLKGTKQSPSSTSSQETSTSVYAQSSKCCPTDVNLESGCEDADHSRIEDNCVEYYVAQDPYQYSVQSSPRLVPVREVPSDVYSSASDGSQESLTSETYSEFDGLSSLGQCQKHSVHPMPPHVSSHPNQGYSGHLSYSSTYLGYSHQYSQQQMPISSSRYPTVVPNTGVLMCQPNVPILQPCPVIIDGSAPVVGRSIPYIPMHPCGNPVATTPSLEPLNSSGLV